MIYVVERKTCGKWAAMGSLAGRPFGYRERYVAVSVRARMSRALPGLSHRIRIIEEPEALDFEVY